MEKNLTIRNSTAEFLIFQLENREDGVQLLYSDETLWLTQEAISLLFDKSRSTIAEHLQNVFASGERAVWPDETANRKSSSASEPPHRARRSA